MARNFIASSEEYLTQASRVTPTVPPFTMAARFITAQDTVPACMISVNRAVSGANQHALLYDGGTDEIGAMSRDNNGSTAARATAGTVTADGLWHSAVGTWTSSTRRDVYLDGVQGDPNTTSKVPNTQDRTGIGALYDSSTNWWWDGDLAEIAVWSVVLDQVDISAYAAGFSPLLIRRDVLSAYWPLMGTASPEPELINGKAGTLVATPTHSGYHPRVIMPDPPKLYFPGVATSSGALTGTAIDGGVLESEIVAGGQTIIITLTNDTWAAAGTGPIGSTADTQALIDGCTASTTPTNGWNNEVRDKEPTTIVVRTSPTVATLTLTTAAAAYDISSDETITITIPAAVLVTSGSAVVATPTFVVTAAAGAGLLPGSLALLGAGL